MWNQNVSKICVNFEAIKAISSFLYFCGTEKKTVLQLNLQNRTLIPQLSINLAAALSSHTHTYINIHTHIHKRSRNANYCTFTYLFLSKAHATINPTLDPIILPPFHLVPKKRWSTKIKDKANNSTPLRLPPR